MKKSTRALKLSRDMMVDQFMDVDGLLYLWEQIKNYVGDSIAEIPSGGGSSSGIEVLEDVVIDSTNTYDYFGEDEGRVFLMKNVVFDTAWRNGSDTGRSDTDSVIYNTIVYTYREIPSPTLGRRLTVISLDGFYRLFRSPVSTDPQYPHGLVIEKEVDFAQGSSGGGNVAWNDITDKPTNLVTIPEMTAAIQDAVDSLDDDLEVVKGNIGSLETAVAARPTEAQVDEKINSKIVGVYRFMGSVPSYANLPTSGMVNGDVYDVEDMGGMNYGWVEDSSQPSGGYWDPLGQIFHIEPIPNSVIKAIVEGTYGQE